MKNLLLVIVLLTSLNVSAEELSINLSKEQLFNLGIKVGALKSVKSIPLLTAAAKVSIPANQEHIISASQAGLVNELRKTVGDKVKKGELISRMNSPKLVVLQNEYLRSINERNLVQATYQRDRRLSEGGIIPDKRLQESHSRLSTASIEENTAIQLLDIAGMSKKRIKKLRQSGKLDSHLNIYSPISGVILEKMVSVGERLDMLEPLYRVANLDKLLLEIDIPQEKINRIQVGDNVSIENSKANARVTLLTESVNVENQTILVRAMVEGNKSNLRVGQSIKVQIEHNSSRGAFEVPNVAIAKNEGLAYIFIRTETGFLIRPIDVLAKKGEQSIITGNLTGSEQIALRGAVALKANWLGLGSEE